ncbi:MAG: RDD family protein [Myxococcota bacterium]
MGIAMDWYILEGDRRVGPVTTDALRAMAAMGRVQADTWLWHSGMADWVKASSIPGIVSPPPSPSDHDHAVPPEFLKGEEQRADAPLSPRESLPGIGAATAASEAALEASDVGLATPWRRYWARSLDILVFSFAIGIGLGAVAPSLFAEGGVFGGPGGTYLSNWLMLPFVMLLDGLVVGLFGTTLGKAIAGIRTCRISGERLSIRTAIQRNFEIWWYGLGTGLPIITLLTLANAYSQVADGKMAHWEASSGARSFAPGGAARTWVTAITYLMLFVGGMALGESGAANLRTAISATKPASSQLSIDNLLQQVADEINRIAPMDVDDQTRLTGATAGPGLQITYEFTLPAVDVSGLEAADIDGFRVLARENLQPNVCTGDTMKPLREAGVNIRYAYFDANGLPVMTIGFMPEDCKP